MKKIILTFVLIGLALSISGGLVLADVFAGDDTLDATTVTSAALLAKIAAVANWVFVILLVLSVFMILIAAFQFVTGGPEGVGEARQKLIWAVVGIVLAFLARAIPAVVVNILA